jgi:Glycosyltransferase family 87
VSDPALPERHRHRIDFNLVREGARRQTRIALWVGALAVAIALAYLRWRTASNAPAGADFRYSLTAARDVAAGRSPYLVKQYVYPPPLALILAPFVHAQVVTVWKVWVGVIVAAPLVGIAAFTWLVRGRLAWWLHPAVFAAAAFTVYYNRYFPLSRDLSLGQSDTIVFSVLAVSALAASRLAARTRGTMTGLAGLVKVWPWAAAVAVLQPGVTRRRQTLLYAGAVALLAPLTALIFGWSGLTGFIRNDFDARQQRLVSDSVWSAPQLLFSHSGLAQPVTTSTTLRVALTAMLTAWVLMLLIVAIRTLDDRALGTWNVIFCVILLLPVSHRQYAICVLPLLWWWTITAITQGPTNWRVIGVAALLVMWWVNQTLSWPYNGASNDITALRYCVPFVGDLVACTVSVLGAALASSTTRTGQTPLHSPPASAPSTLPAPY